MLLDKIDTWLADQKDDLILWLPVFLGFGSAFYYGLKTEPSVFLTATAWLGSIFVLIAVYSSRRHSRVRFTFFTVALVIFFCISGFTVAKLRTSIVYTPLILKETRPVMVEGDVVHLETLEGNKGTSLLLENLKIENFQAAQTPRQIKLSSKFHLRFNLGDRVSVLAKLMPLSMPVMPDAYDFRRHYFFDSIGANGFILKAPVVVRAASIPESDLFLEKLRKSMGDHIANLLPVRLAGIVNALVTGERASILDDDWNALRISGLAHIISISGLHVVLFAMPIFFIVRFILAAIPFIALRYPVKKIAAASALAACCLYVGLVVPTVPTYRALLMTGIGLIAIMIDRSPFSLRLISFSAVIVLLIAPESIWSASFQLSFAAVLSLIISAGWMKNYWLKWRASTGRTGKLLLYLGASVFTTLVVSAVTAPLASYHFQQIPVYSVVANGLTLPLTEIIIMPMTILTFLSWPFGLQDWPLKIMGYGIEWMLAIAHGTANWPGATIRLSAWPLSSLVCFTMAGLGLYLLRGRLRLLVFPAVLIGTLLIFLTPRPDIIVSDEGTLLLVRDGHDVYLSSPIREKFAAQSWLKRLGVNPKDIRYFPQEGQIQLSDGAITCGENMCRIQKAARKISFGTDYYALRQDCDWADTIVTANAFRDRACTAKVFNKFTFFDTGALAIASDGSIVTVAETLGIRPWSPLNDRTVSGWKAHPGSARGPRLKREAYTHRSQVQE